MNKSTNPMYVGYCIQKSSSLPYRPLQGFFTCILMLACMRKLFFLERIQQDTKINPEQEWGEMQLSLVTILASGCLYLSWNWWNQFFCPYYFQKWLYPFGFRVQAYSWLILQTDYDFLRWAAVPRGQKLNFYNFADQLEHWLGRGCFSAFTF